MSKIQNVDLTEQQKDPQVILEQKIMGFRKQLQEKGEVSETLRDGTFWSLELGNFWNGDLSLIPEKALRFHPTQNIISFWRNSEHLAEYERRMQVNQDYIEKFDVSGDRAPYSFYELQNMAVATIDLDLKTIYAMVEKERVKGEKTCLVRFHNERGFVPVLKVTFKSN